MKKIVVLVLALASVGSFAQGAFWSGDTTGRPVMNRPSSLTSLSGVGTAVAYEVMPFYTDCDGQHVFEVNGVSHPDTFIMVYGATFNPATPLVGLINGDDDFSGTFTCLTGVGQGFASSRIALGEPSNFSAAGLLLAANTQYYAVVTGFGNTDFGTYDAGICGPVGCKVTLGVVPEPGSMIALGAGLAAIAARRRRK